MKTIKCNISNEIVIKNSRFITLLYKIDKSSNILEILEEVKKQFPKATHYCYAYRTETHEKSSDDGEPGGTAGLPMLNVLIKEKVINVLAITIRYFGGIKLGAGGLVRAYTKSLTEALALKELVSLEKGYLIKLTTDYSKQKILDYTLKDINIIKKDFAKEVIYLIEISKEKLGLIKDYDYEIIEDKLIEVLL